MTATVRGISREGREGSIDLENREWTAVYLVQTDDKLDGPKEVAEAFGIPELGTLYSVGNDFDNATIVTGIEPRQTSSPFEWEVRVTYGLPDAPDINAADNPLDQAAEWSIDFNERTAMLGGFYSDPSNPDVDGNFDIIAEATNGEPFDPQPEVAISEPIFVVTKNYASISAADLMAVANTVNDTTFQGAPPRTLRMLGPQAQRKTHPEIGVYWTVTFRLAYKFDTWDGQYLNHGSYYLDSSSEPQVVLDGGGTPKLVNLTSTGGLLGDGEDPTFTRIQHYRRIDFNSLGIF